MSTRTPSRWARFAALTLSTAILGGGLVAGTAAQAAPGDVDSRYGTYVGELHVSPSSGAWNEKPTRVWTDTAFDAAITEDSHPFRWLGMIKGPQYSGLTYLNGNSLYTGPVGGPFNFGSDPAATGGDIIQYSFAENGVGNVDSSAVGTTFAVVMYAKADVDESRTDPYFRADFVVTATGWEVVGGAPVVKTDTTTALVPTANNNGSVTLSATVSAAATGDVSFIDAATNLPVGSGTLASGVASTTVSGLAANATYNYKAVYAGDTTHNGSESSTVQVNTVAEPQAPQNTAITVVIPADATGLKFTITAGDIALVASGTAKTFTGQLGAVTVSDNRATRGAWALNGQVTDFVKAGTPAGTIGAQHLGWAPALVGATNGGTAGAAVVAGTGLKAAQSLAAATGTPTVATTTVGAGLTLVAPADTVAGSYSTTLTLTLI